ncbi:MAG: glycoside hydrolase family 3 C-terminal domain-containing protein [Clostridiales bacterium]|jgi:beta-glucosidase-like glycosyl hydrolase|nr:glycoside hydrolase family 3 C-terminal domain-containing protein [Clostridiales bacterium]
MSKTKFRLRAVSALLAVSMLLSLWLYPLGAYAAEEVTFATLPAGHYYQEGMPLFDGNPDHLEAYLDAYLDWAGPEGWALYSTGIRDAYQLTKDTSWYDGVDRTGWVLPGGLSAADDMQGISNGSVASTDLPAMIGLGQSWNKELVRKVGDVLGTEKMASLIGEFTPWRNNHNRADYLGVSNETMDIDTEIWGERPEFNSTTIAFTLMHDLRINPLSGRVAEGFAEDPLLAGQFIDEMAKGFAAYDDESGDGDFYTRGVVGTKHFSVYNAQWFRTTSSVSAGPRSIYEYNVRSALPGLMSGAMGGVMSSFGRTNGISNELAAYNILGDSVSKYGMYSSPDFNGENGLFTEGSMGNGYDTAYVPDRAHALALMALAHTESVRAMGTDKTDPGALYDLIQSGAYGDIWEDVRDNGKPLLTQMIRAGLFDEVDENGFSKFNPYNAQFRDYEGGTAQNANYNNEDHQEVALQAARETIVLLKNDGALPLDKDMSLAVAGYMGDARFRNRSASTVTPPQADVPESGDSPLKAILRSVGYDGGESVSYNEGVPVIAIKTSEGFYLTAPEGEGGNVTVSDITDAAGLTGNELFEVFDWGQSSYSLRSVANGMWLTSPGAAPFSFGPPPTTPVELDLNVYNNNNTPLSLSSNGWTSDSMESVYNNIPPRVGAVDNGDGTIAIVSNWNASGFAGGFEAWYYANCRYMEINEGNLMAAGKAVGSDGPADNQRFTLELIESAAAGIVTEAQEKDAAVIVVGAIPTHQAGEGADRFTLAMGGNDYLLVKETAAAFAAEGKDVVVVIRTNFPVLAEEIHNDPNVSAIIYQPYAGQYDGKALAEVIYGDYAPTGRLTSTWYKSDDVLDPISVYSIPEGNANTLETLDPRVTKDMSNADAYDQELTYMYANPGDVTYEFGYGLSYSDFSYGSLNGPGASDASGPLVFTVEVSNTGGVDTSEVVQLYARNNLSAYGESAANKLAAFEKVELKAGETKTVELTVDPYNLEIWDVNAAGYIVESGDYTFSVGQSFENVKGTVKVDITARDLAPLDASEPFSVFDHSFAAHDVIYREVSKENTVNSLKEEAINGGYSAVYSKSGGAWVAIPKADLTSAETVTAMVASDAASGDITLRLGSPSGPVIAAIAVPVTDPVDYTPETFDYAVKELGYTAVEADLTQAVSGEQTLYVVFESGDLRIDTLTFGR